eukprot:gnl/TRDRNA2_/TRDRNA2_195648_c0_seq1.p1 gnl/TRDRNA2_/TRDRNA2_195648_c0~~gnl/TRDRNA2_/TRDRNA2_195648_c0_seq1.p1  ORF type:complete len:343 (-),score=43.81 gnl/TRDRNA2_/TRDRNA2_195648_c0_seq1:77-1105(-)
MRQRALAPFAQAPSYDVKPVDWRALDARMSAQPGTGGLQTSESLPLLQGKRSPLHPSGDSLPQLRGNRSPLHQGRLPIQGSSLSGGAALAPGHEGFRKQAVADSMRFRYASPDVPKPVVACFSFSTQDLTNDTLHRQPRFLIGDQNLPNDTLHRQPRFRIGDAWSKLALDGSSPEHIVESTCSAQAAEESSRAVARDDLKVARILLETPSAFELAPIKSASPKVGHLPTVSASLRQPEAKQVNRVKSGRRLAGSPNELSASEDLLRVHSLSTSGFGATCPEMFSPERTLVPPAMSEGSAAPAWFHRMQKRPENLLTTHVVSRHALDAFDARMARTGMRNEAR